MNDASDKGGIAVAVGLLLLLLLGILGAGAYFVVSRQQAALAMQAERARASEVEANMMAENARAQAEIAIARRIASDDKPTLTAEGESIGAAVETILRAQEEAWNRGDVDEFMEHYWKSDNLTFSSGGATTRGWEATLNRYRERYPTREQMGRLTLSGLEITPLGDSAALVLGQWNVERESTPVSGNFSLVVRKFDGRWLIVHDHTFQKTD
ncbi:MAG TPA: nuclear transport factor 2 family protein [Lacipirellulaceae bacterium]|nr:nuclear transport factor 2 family protein [Lacipirellulaceae bacterium]